MATGFAVCGFGGGAMLAAPLKERLLKYYFEAPDYVGSLGGASVQQQQQ
jgi:hypothetical protein